MPTGPDRIGADAAGFAAALAGLAHVVVLVDDAAVRAVAGGARCRAQRSNRVACACSGPTGVRPIRRRGTRSGGPRRSSVPTGRARACSAALRDAVIDAATLRIDDDTFVARLARADSAQELAGRRAELARRQQAALDDRAAAHELVDEYQRELTIADDEVFRLEAALEREHELPAACGARVPAPRDA